MRSPESELQALDDANLRRRLRVPDGLINFSSNDYLGLAQSEELKAVFQEAIGRWGAGSGASRLVCGTLPPHVALEEALAAFKHTEAALTFSSGYAASVGTLTALLGKDDIVILDKLCHASLVDGARLSGATIRVFPHNHLEKLQQHLAWANKHRSASGRVLIVTESIFSMDGDAAPLKEIVKLKNAADAWLLVDEAHALGIMGKDGRGLADELGVGEQIELHLGTLSKAAGLSGGYICGSRAIIDLLINKARSFIYTTAPPPALAAAAAHVIAEIFPSAQGQLKRETLMANARQLSLGLSTIQAGGHQLTARAAIHPLIIGEETAAMQRSQALEKSGFLVPAIRFPTVPKGSARLRITVSSEHASDSIEALLSALQA